MAPSTRKQKRTEEKRNGEKSGFNATMCCRRNPCANEDLEESENQVNKNATSDQLEVCHLTTSRAETGEKESADIASAANNINDPVNMMNRDQEEQRENREVEAENDQPTTSGERNNKRPPYSYVALITMAILQSPENKLTLSEICQFIINKFPYYKERYPTWQNFIRHNLSHNDCFIKIPRDQDEKAKGNFWAIDPDAENMFDNGSFRRRKKRFKKQRKSNDVERCPTPRPSEAPYPGVGQWVARSESCSNQSRAAQISAVALDPVTPVVLPQAVGTSPTLPSLSPAFYSHVAMPSLAPTFYPNVPIPRVPIPSSAPFIYPRVPLPSFAPTFYPHPPMPCFHYYPVNSVELQRHVIRQAENNHSSGLESCTPDRSVHAQRTNSTLQSATPEPRQNDRPLLPFSIEAILRK